MNTTTGERRDETQGYETLFAKIDAPHYSSTYWRSVSFWCATTSGHQYADTDCHALDYPHYMKFNVFDRSFTHSFRMFNEGKYKKKFSGGTKYSSGFTN